MTGPRTANDSLEPRRRRRHRPLPPGDPGLVGARLGARYTVTRLLGRGGMAFVYAALDERCDRTVVVKFPRVELLRVRGLKRRFEREIRSQTDLDHPRIAKVLDRGHHDGWPYVVIQYLDGGNLQQLARARGGVQSPAQVLAWLHEVALTLDYVHRRGFVHRDVKPGNILFDGHGHAFLSDFGLVKGMGPAATDLTVAGAVPGTPSYMAPEQGEGDPAKPAADQYALASTVYEMLAGRLPYDRGTPLHVLAVKYAREPISLGVVAPHVPDTTVAVVMRALSRAPGDRYPTCLAFARAFRASLCRRASACVGADVLRIPVPWLLFPVTAILVITVLVLFLLYPPA